MAIPKKDSLLVPFATNFDTRVTATPTVFSFVAAQASALHAVVTPYVAAYNAMMEAREAGNRSSSLAEIKDANRDQMLDILRPMYGQVQTSGTVSDANKTLLGVTVRKAPSPIAAPTVVPDVDFVSVVGFTVTLDVHGPEEGKKGFPAGVKGVQIYTFIGAEPSADPEDWFFQGGITRSSKIEIEFPVGTTPGAKVWFRACFFSPRNQCGPASEPISTHLQFSSASMKQAA